MAGLTATAKMQNHVAWVTAAVAAYGSLDETVKKLGATVATVAPAMKAEMSDTGTAITKVAEGLKDVAQEWQDKQLGMLEALKQKIIPFEGADAGSQFSFDKIIDDQIAKVKSGQETAQEAIQELQRQFGSTYNTLQQQYFGSQDPATRDFLAAMEQFINSGNVNL